MKIPKFREGSVVWAVWVGVKWLIVVMLIVVMLIVAQATHPDRKRTLKDYIAVESQIAELQAKLDGIHDRSSPTTNAAALFIETQIAKGNAKLSFLLTKCAECLDYSLEVK